MTTNDYDPNGHLIEMAGRYMEVIFDADGDPVAIRDDGPVGPVWWCGPSEGFTEEMREAGWINMNEEADDD